jgi:PKD repeat protein
LEKDDQDTGAEGPGGPVIVKSDTMKYHQSDAKNGATMRLAAIAIIAALLAVALLPLTNDLSGSENDAGALASRPASVTFTNVSVAAGLSGVYGNYLAWGDYNRDGWQDILVQGTRLFRNNGPPGWNFTEVTAAANLSGSYTSGTWGDYDNDGWLDFYATSPLDKQDKLCRNNGNGTFDNVTEAAGNVSDSFPSTASGWGDYDRDGDLDLYVTGGETTVGTNFIGWPDTFWKNNGDGTFANATLSANLSEGNHPYYGRGVAWGDFNNDGWPDIYISNYRLSPNYIYVNNQNGTFTEMAKELDCAGVYDPDRYHDAYTGSDWGPQYGHTIGSAWADFDNNGDLDLWTTNLVHKYVGPTGDPTNPYDIRGYVCDDSKMYRNRGAPYYNFSDIRASSGIATKPIGGSGVYQGDELFDGVAWGDFDNDGDVDIWIPQVYDLTYAYSYLYEQDGTGNASCHWTDRAQELGMRVYNTYAGVWCDYDNDGDLDLLTAGKSPFVSVGNGTYALHLYKNNGNTNQWLRINLTGGDCNRAAIGARVTVKSGNLTQMREVEGGMGCHGSQNSLVQHFGFFNRTKADWVEVMWPCGRIERFSNVSLNQTLNITESSLPVPSITSATVTPDSVAEDAAVDLRATASVSGGTIAKWEWDFTSDNRYDWSSNANADTMHSYSKNGTYNIRLRIWSSQGIGTVYGPVVIHVFNLPPVADAGDDQTVYMDSEMFFDGSRSWDTLGDNARGLMFNWSFGDGSFSEWDLYSLAFHIYIRPGVYNVTLAVRDDDGAIDLAHLNITVRNVAPAIGPLADMTADEDETVRFTPTVNDTSSDRAKLLYEWDFGDGNSTVFGPLANTSHVYVMKGNYAVVFRVKDPAGEISAVAFNVTVLNPAPDCSIGDEYRDRTAREDLVLGFDGTGADNPSDLPSLRYRWDFGDGNSTDWSTSTSTLHSYSIAGLFNVTFTVMDDDNDTKISNTTIRITDVVPTAEIVTEEQTIDEDSVLELEGKGEDTASDQSMLQYRWDFGDGNLSGWLSAPMANHSYPATGRYRAALTARDDENATAVSEPVFITVANLPPVAVAGASSKTVNEDATVFFTGQNSTDTPSDMDALTYYWSFGDGTDAEGINITHSYKKSGTYSVRLRVTDADAAFSDDTSIWIKVRNVAPTVTAAANRTTAWAGGTISFNATGNDTPSDMPALNFIWHFGDGASAGGANVTHLFSKEITYNVRVEVTDPEGEKAEAQLTVVISPQKKPAPAQAGGPDIAIVAGGIIAAVIIAIVLLAALFRGRAARR